MMNLKVSRKASITFKQKTKQKRPLSSNGRNPNCPFAKHDHGSGSDVVLMLCTQLNKDLLDLFSEDKATVWYLSSPTSVNIYNFDKM